MKTLHRFITLIAPFWFNRKHWLEWLLLAAVVGLALLLIRVSVAITEWNKTFYDALAAFQSAQMPALIGQYLLYISLVVAIAVSASWLRKVLLFRWRAHLTAQFQQHWLDQHKHYRLQLTDEPDNPDQRIAEDIYLLAEKSIDLFKNFVMNVAKLVAFVAILWQLSGVQTLEIAGTTWQIHGYLVWVALIYSLLCTLFTHLIGRKLQPLNVERQHREADFRATLLRVRDHSEQIALYHGEQRETQRLNQRFAHIKHNWRELINRELKLEIFSATYLRVSMFIPIFATLPMYLARTMTFGDMMQARSAFSNVQDGFGWFMDYYKRIIEWAAVVERLANFQQALAEAGNEPPHHLAEKMPSELNIHDLCLLNRHNQPLLQHVSLYAQAGQWWLLNGQSGIGKSSLLRVLAGLSPHYQGEFSLRAESFLFLPQRPYLPQDSLRAVLCYPNTQTATDKQLQQALTAVGLGALSTQLDEEKEWGKLLSGGEQQRISLARALLNEPKMLFLDEATNQLDDHSALALMKTLRQHLPQTLCVGISHQAEVKALFEFQLDLSAFKA